MLGFGINDTLNMPLNLTTNLIGTNNFIGK